MATSIHIKPMLDFVSVPEAVSGRRRRRRCVVKTPKNPKVKAVPLHENQQPLKWVSPQFNVAETRACVRRRARGVLEIKSSKRTLQLNQGDSLHISLYPDPSLAPCCTDRKEEETVASPQRSDTNTDTSGEDTQTLNALTDQTVPEIALEDARQHSPEDSDATTGDSSVEDLSALVGNLSLEDAAAKPEPSLPMDCTEPHPQEPYTCSMTNISLKDNELSLSKYTQTNCAENEREAATSVFKPPSTSTPCRTDDTPPPNSDSLLTKNSSFQLHLTETTTDSRSEDELLDNYEETSGSDLDVILAFETPQHLWRSPEVKVIDNTFS